MEKNADWLMGLRQSLGFTQAEMGQKMGLSGRAYVDVEHGVSKLRLLHINAAERIALGEAVARRDPMLAPPEVRREALEVARLITG
jgi:DNA-binding XRE family transcriptional regulator